MIPPSSPRATQAPAQKTPASQPPSQPLTLKASPMAPSSRSPLIQATAQRPSILPPANGPTHQPPTSTAPMPSPSPSPMTPAAPPHKPSTLTVTAVDDSAVVSSGSSGSGEEDSSITATLSATDVEGLTDGSVFSVSSDQRTLQRHRLHRPWLRRMVLHTNCQFQRHRFLHRHHHRCLGGTTTQAISSDRHRR